MSLSFLRFELAWRQILIVETLYGLNVQLALLADIFKNTTVNYHSNFNPTFSRVEKLL